MTAGGALAGAVEPADEEIAIMKATTGGQKVELRPTLSGDDILALQDIVRRIPVGDHVFKYAASLSRATRPNEAEAPEFVKKCVSWGAGPRASQYLILGAKARAALYGRNYATTEDVAAVALPVLRHRILTNFNAEADGVTLSVDLARSDLLLETEVQRFAEPIERPGTPGRRFYRITPASILAARQQGSSLASLEIWFVQRTGLPISAAAQLLMSGPDTAAVELRRLLVLRVGNEHLADGLQQWPGTRPLIRARLGPTTLVVDEADVPVFVEHLKEIGVKVLFEA